MTKINSCCVSVLGTAIAALAVLSAPIALYAQTATPPGNVTFSKDVAPILERACQDCHHKNSIAPMSLVTYQETRPWARSIKQRVTRGPHAGVMPPWFVEKDIGIQQFNGDMSLTDAEIATLVKWVDNGAAAGNPADTPKAKVSDDSGAWTIGEPDHRS